MKEMANSPELSRALEYHYSRVALQCTPRRVRKKYVVMVVRCMRTENFPIHEIGTWDQVRYNGGYVVNWLRCNAPQLYLVFKHFTGPAQTQIGVETENTHSLMGDELGGDVRADRRTKCAHEPIARTTIPDSPSRS